LIKETAGDTTVTENVEKTINTGIVDQKDGPKTLNLRFKGTPYELARIVGWGGTYGTGIIRKRELSGLDTPLEVEKNNRPVQRAIFKAARRLDASAAGDGLADLAYEPINQQAQSVQIKVKRFQFPGEGQIFGEIEPGERMTWLTVTPLDEHWRDYPDSDGWAMLYREINRRGLFVVTPGQDTAGEGQVGLADGKTAPQLSKEDEDLRLAQIAQKYSNKNGEGKILPNSIKTWERIVPLKRVGVSHEKTAENLGMESSTFIYHWRKMKKTGYWEDHKQEN
jgi:hypothetical protein